MNQPSQTRITGGGGNLQAPEGRGVDQGVEGPSEHKRRRGAGSPSQPGNRAVRRKDS